MSRSNTIRRTDIEQIVVHTTTIISQECECLDCGQTTIPKTGQTLGTSFGPNLQKTVLRLWEDNVPVWRIARFVGEMIGEKISPAAIQNCLKACSKRLEPVAEEIKKSVAEAEFVNIDETRVWKRGKMCHAWVFVTMYAAWYLIAGDRGGAVLDVHFPYPSAKVGSDGYVVYGRFEVRQRCWSHILRKAKFLADHTDNRDGARMLHLLLQQLFVDSKDLAARNAMSMHDHLVQEAIGLADRYDKAGFKKFAFPWRFRVWITSTEKNPRSSRTLLDLILNSEPPSCATPPRTSLRSCCTPEWPPQTTLPKGACARWSYTARCAGSL